jgi:hypothetical protein
MKILFLKILLEKINIRCPKGSNVLYNFFDPITKASAKCSALIPSDRLRLHRLDKYTSDDYQMIITGEYEGISNFAFLQPKITK